MAPREQWERLRTAVSDAIQDSLGMMMLDEETLEDMLDAVMDAISRLVYP
jgi:hypothetical protein